MNALLKYALEYHNFNGKRRVELEVLLLVNPINQLTIHKCKTITKCPTLQSPTKILLILNHFTLKIPLTSNTNSLQNPNKPLSHLNSLSRTVLDPLLCWTYRPLARSVEELPGYGGVAWK